MQAEAGAALMAAGGKERIERLPPDVRRHAAAVVGEDDFDVTAREGDIGGPLREIANAHPDTIIGSYPFMDDDKKPNTNLVVRSRDPEKLSAAMAAVKEMLAGIRVSGDCG